MKQSGAIITAIGTSAGFVSAEYGCQAHLVQVGSISILFDVSEAAASSELVQSLKINCIFVSHSHADHCAGLPRILMLQQDVFDNRPLLICDLDVLSLIQAYERAFHRFSVNFLQLTHATPQRFSIEGLSCLTVPLEHAIPCSGLIIEDLDLCVLSDGHYAETNIKCRYLICECTYPAPNSVHARDRGHSTETEVIQLAQRSGCEHCWVTHFSLKYIDDLHTFYAALAGDSKFGFLKQGKSIEIK